MTEPISAEFPYESRFAEVLGSRMHYVEVGEGEVTALFLHGNPTSSYLWRNILPHVAPHARCIAPDLPGMGRSDKPPMDHRVAEHAERLEAFISRLDLVKGASKLILVLHDWGSALGLDWARRHESAVAGLVLMEFILPCPTWLDFPARGREIFKKFRTKDVGRDLIIGENAFVERILPAGVVRPLAAAEMRAYRAPFVELWSREPTWRFPNELPIAGEPVDVYAMAQAYQTWLFATDVPKLFFWGSPGGLISQTDAERFARVFRHCRSVHVGRADHFLQEDNPHLIGREIAAWVDGEIR